MINYREVTETVIRQLDKIMGQDYQVAPQLCLSQEARRVLRENPTPANTKQLDTYLNNKLRVNWFTTALCFAEIGLILLSLSEDANSPSQYLRLWNRHLALIQKVKAAKHNGGTNKKLVLEVEEFLEAVKEPLFGKLQGG